MKVEIRTINNSIEVGDVVNYKVRGSRICLVVYDDMKDSFPYRLICLDSGKVLNGYSSLEAINESESVRLLAKSHEITISNYVDRNGNV